MGYHFTSRLTATLNLCLNYVKLLVHVLKQCGQCSCDFKVNQTKIKGGCQSGRKVVPQNSNCKKMGSPRLILRNVPICPHGDQVESILQIKIDYLIDFQKEKTRETFFRASESFFNFFNDFQFLSSQLLDGTADLLG